MTTFTTFIDCCDITRMMFDSLSEKTESVYMLMLQALTPSAQGRKAACQPDMFASVYLCVWHGAQFTLSFILTV